MNNRLRICRTDESSIAGCVGGATARGIGLARFALLYLLFTAVALAFAMPSFAQTQATDNFNRPDGGLGANWTTNTIGLALQIVGNRVQTPPMNTRSPFTPRPPSVPRNSPRSSTSAGCLAVSSTSSFERANTPLVASEMATSASSTVSNPDGRSFGSPTIRNSRSIPGR